MRRPRGDWPEIRGRSGWKATSGLCGRSTFRSASATRVAGRDSAVAPRGKGRVSRPVGARRNADGRSASSRIDPVIRQLRRAIVGAVEGYVSQLPARTTNIRCCVNAVTGACDFPAAGRCACVREATIPTMCIPWAGSAPPSMSHFPTGHRRERRFRLAYAGRAQSGTLGSTFRRGGRSSRKPARLVLFPSWMWHGTVPFADGERLTVAFDVAQPT